MAVDRRDALIQIGRGSVAAVLWPTNLLANQNSVVVGLSYVSALHAPLIWRCVKPGVCLDVRSHRLGMVLALNGHPLGVVPPACMPMPLRQWGTVRIVRAAKDAGRSVVEVMIQFDA